MVQIGKHDEYLEVNIVSTPVRRQAITIAIISKVIQSSSDNGFKKVLHDTSLASMALINIPGLEFSTAGNVSNA